MNSPQPRKKKYQKKSNLSKKKFTDVKCPNCNEKHNITKNGSYSRHKDYHNPECKERERIQRYICHVKKCPRLTFSIPNPELLPVVRYTLPYLLDFLVKFDKFCQNIYKVAVFLKLYWSTAKRILKKAEEVKKWIEQKGDITESLRDPSNNWVDFCQHFSRKFYPQKFVKN